MRESGSSIACEESVDEYPLAMASAAAARPPEAGIANGLDVETGTFVTDIFGRVEGLKKAEARTFLYILIYLFAIDSAEKFSAT